jgi:hypothetical protein
VSSRLYYRSIRRPLWLYWSLICRNRRRFSLSKFQSLLLWISRSTSFLISQEHIHLWFDHCHSQNRNQKMTNFPAKTKLVSSLLAPESKAMQVSILLIPLIIRSWLSQFVEILLLQLLLPLLLLLLTFSQLYLYLFVSVFSFAFIPITPLLFTQQIVFHDFARSPPLTLLLTAWHPDHQLLDLLLQVQTMYLVQSQQQFPVRTRSECHFQHSLE